MKFLVLKLEYTNISLYIVSFINFIAILGSQIQLLLSWSRTISALTKGDVSHKFCTWWPDDCWFPIRYSPFTVEAMALSSKRGSSDLPNMLWNLFI